MATQNVTVADSDKQSTAGRKVFHAVDAEHVRFKVQSARVMLRTVALAIEAQEDQSVSFEFAGVERWGPVIGQVCESLRDAKNVLMDTPKAPTWDWVTSLTLAEALDASMWYGNSLPAERKLDCGEVAIAVQLIIFSLDALLIECAQFGTESEKKMH